DRGVRAGPLRRGRWRPRLCRSVDRLADEPSHPWPVNGIPRPEARPWYVKETWGSIGGVLVALLAGSAAIVREASNENRSGWLLGLLAAGLVAGVWVAVLKIAQSRHKDAHGDREASPDDLRGCLHVTHRAVAGFKKLPGTPPSGWLRITLHRVDTDKLEQTVDYVGSEDKGAG